MGKVKNKFTAKGQLWDRNEKIRERIKRVVKGRRWYFDDFYYQEYCRAIKPIKKNRWQRNHPKKELPF